MSCELSQVTVHGYFDGELDAVRAGEFEKHIESCSYCRTALDQMQSLHMRLQESDLYERASPGFAERIQSELAAASGEKRERVKWTPRLLVPAFSLAAIAFAFWAALYLVQPHTKSAQITAELVDAHVRSLQPGHLMDVPSTDQHTVKPWFDGKIDFIPPVADYTQQGFSLIGGRLDVVDGHNVAVLVYSRAKHVVNLFVWPVRGSGSSLESSGAKEGYNWILWRSGDMEFCLVSDTAPASLSQLKDLIHP